MKVALLTSEKSSIDPFPLVEKVLRDNIAGIDVQRIVAPENLSLIRKTYEAENFDLVCVALYYEKESADIAVLVRKIVDLELSGRKMLKFIEPGDEFDENEQAELISDVIMKKLVGKVAPKKEKYF